MRVVVVINGPVPAKKNRWHRSGKGKMYFDQSGITEQIAAITWQARAQWGTRPPVINPEIFVTFYCKDLRGDIDNKLSTLLDCLVVAGVLADDNLKHLKGPITIRGEVDKNERTEIKLESQ
jgi:Holliday junction resolvase RusA-like endonuclease